MLVLKHSMDRITGVSPVKSAPAPDFKRNLGELAGEFPSIRLESTDLI
jgi:hypothetical protein